MSAPTALPSIFASCTVTEVNEMLAAAQRAGGCDGHLLAELHERAAFEDEARAATEDEWTRGFLIAAAEWARPWPTDPR